MVRYEQITREFVENIRLTFVDKLIISGADANLFLANGL